ncbi:MAG: orotidine-5'-phosphate decarboxylase [Clostridiales bacterium]|jgi:orotidine-5'-phosphate decarboxylase|nr:orotidine-5'-phosphate decarboxylase [Clostridiales bacterium]
MAIDELVRRMRGLGNPSVIGLDPRLESMPRHLAENAKTLSEAADAILEFNKALIDELWDIVPAVKPQIAFYEAYGWQGIKAYIETVAYAKKKGLIVIGDIKRGDIASTAQAYAEAHLGPVYGEDFSTVNPYMGEDSLEPFIKVCKERSKGIFVLVKTSNPGSGQLQDLMVLSNGVQMPLYESVGLMVKRLGEDLIGECGYSEIGAVTGVTHPAQAKRLRELMPRTLFLAPGYGAQGAKAIDIADGSIVNSSRGIIEAHTRSPYKERFGEAGFAKAARAAALDMREDLLCLRI